jgi:gamma-glutamyltranspeptidase/glutathione hydrolase
MSILRAFTLATLLTTTAAFAQQATDAIAPEGGTAPAAFAGLSIAAQASLTAKEAGVPVTAENWMIAAANPLAAEAGAEVLRTGGSAADAMVAVQAVLGLVEPQSSGLGGGAFLVWYDAATGALTTLDGRETAPLAVTPKAFLGEDGQPLKFWDAVVGGLSVGTPGTPMLMAEAHRRWGRADWAGLLEPAISLAQDGFAVSPRMAGAIASDADRLQRFASTAAYFFPGGTALSASDIKQNPDYAETLRLIAQNGTDAFYSGPVAEDIVRTVREAMGNPGHLSMALPHL